MIRLPVEADSLHTQIAGFSLRGRGLFPGGGFGFRMGLLGVFGMIRVRMVSRFVGVMTLVTFMMVPVMGLMQFLGFIP